MDIILLNFTKKKSDDAKKMLTSNSSLDCNAKILSKTDILEKIEVDFSPLVFLIYMEAPKAEGKLFYELIKTPYPLSIIITVCKSQSLEDIRFIFKNGYNDYLTYPLTKKDLFSVLKKTNDDKPSIEDYYSLPFMDFKKQTFNDRLLKSLTDTESMTACSYYQMIKGQEFDYNKAFIFSVTRFQFPLNNYIDNYFLRVQKPLFSILRLYTDDIYITDNYDFDIMYTYQNNLFCILIYFDKNLDVSNINSQISAFFSLLSMKFFLLTGVKIRIGLSDLYTSILESTTQYNKVLLALDQSFYDVEKYLFIYDNTMKKFTECREANKFIKENIASCVNCGDFSMFIKVISETIDIFKKYNIFSGIAKNMIINEISLFINQSNINKFINMEFMENSLLEIIKSIESAEQIKELLYYINKIYLDNSSKETDFTAETINLAIKYINDNYYKKIRLNDVANFVHLNPNYFSSLFKKETGTNFIEYLIGLRIDVAKKMLAFTDKKIYEIASEIGYDEIVSFNRAFKRVTGLSPQQFRSELTIHTDESE